MSFVLSNLTAGTANPIGQLNPVPVLEHAHDYQSAGVHPKQSNDGYVLVQHCYCGNVKFTELP